MKKTYIFYGILVFILLSFLPYRLISQTWQWTNTSGRYHDDNGECTVFDSSGNIIVSGYFRDTFTLGSTVMISAGNNDMFVAKYSPSGTLLWARKGGGIGEDNAGSVTCDAQGNVYVGGWFNNTFTIGTSNYYSNGGNDMFLAKYNSSGTLQWVWAAGGSGSDKIMGLVTDSYGNCLVTGFFNSTLTLGTQVYTSPGSDQTFVARFSPSGTLHWFTQAGFYPLECWPSGIGRDRVNNIYIAGSFRTQATFGSTTLYTGGANNNIYIAKLDTGGHYRWAKTAAGPLDDYSNGVIADDSGYIYVTGSFFDTLTFPSFRMASAGSKDGFVLQMDSSGNFLWAHNIGGVNSDKGIEVAIDGRRNCYVAGYYNGTSHVNNLTISGYGGDDIVLVKYDRLGNVIWVRTAGGTGNDYGMGVGANFQGDISMTGSFQYTTSFGGTSRTATGTAKDYYLSKLTVIPVITLNQTAGNACEGSSYTFKIRTAGEPPFTYQWQKNGINISIAPNDTFLALSNLTHDDSASYRCIVRNAYGADTSTATMLNVIPLPVVNLGPDTSACQGSTITLNAGPGFSKYTWSTNGSGQYQNISTASTVWVYVTKSGCNSLRDTVKVTIFSRPVVKLPKDTFFCQGDSIRLDAGSGFSAYTWSDGIFSRYNIIKFSKTVSVTVRDTAHSCLSLPDTINVYAYQLPVIKKLPDSTFCEGGIIKLDAGYNSTYTYNWNYSPGNIYLSGLSNISTDSSGVYVVIATTQKGCRKSDTALIIVYPLPGKPLISPPGAISICAGDSVQLIPTPGYTTYTWSDNYSGTARYIKTSGNYWLKVTDFHNCTSPWSDTVSVIVHPLPPKPVIIFITDSISCSGDTILLSASPGYPSYLWSNGEWTEQVAILKARKLSVFVIDTNGCKSPVSDTVTVNFYPLPPVPVINSCTSPSVNYIECTAGGIRYIWKAQCTGQSETILPDSTNKINAGNYCTEGNFWVAVLDSNGCQSDFSSPFFFTKTGIPGNHENLSFQIIPNPAGDFISMQNPSGEHVEMIIYNTDGKVIEQSLLEPGTQKRDISKLPAGIYFVKMVMGDRVMTGKFMKE